MNNRSPPRVAALAGRRPDAADAEEPRFPSAAVPRVRAELEALLQREAVETLVCSAACGADLLALDAARALGLRRVIVLPFAPNRFRETSVVDRPGDWGAMFDAQVAEVKQEGDLIVLGNGPEGAGGGEDAAYAKATGEIVSRAAALVSPAAALGPSARRGAPLAVAVWEGSSRGEGDATEDFLRRARRAGFETMSVSTEAAPS